MSDKDESPTRVPSPEELDRLFAALREGALSRRRFLAAAAAASGAAALGACDTGQQPSDASSNPERIWEKDPAPFIQHGTNLETPAELIRGTITPNELFFVRNHGPTPEVDPATYRLRVEGDAVTNPLELSLDQVLELPRRAVMTYVECAGNWRGFFPETHGRTATGSQWRTGGAGCAEWVGTPLRGVLERAGLSDAAAYVNLMGLDGAEFSRPMPLDKAVDPDTILAYTMNGETLPRDHGYPLRAIVPGWAGSNSVKWVGRIVVSANPIWVRTNTESYVLTGPDWPREQYEPAAGGPITELTLKSALALPWPAQLSPGRNLIRGFAYSPHAAISRVQWSADGGATWADATMVGPVLPRAFTLFEFDWDAPAGSQHLLVRATDEAGNTQPDDVPFNELGYLLNVPVPHPVEVA